MPCYEYRCAQGHQFERVGKMDGSDAPTECITRIVHESKAGVVDDTTCGAPVKKILASPARLFPGADSWRR